MPQIPTHLKRQITRFGQACQDYAHMDAYQPDDWPDVEKEYETSRRNLENSIAKAIAKETSK